MQEVSGALNFGVPLAAAASALLIQLAFFIREIRKSRQAKVEKQELATIVKRRNGGHPGNPGNGMVQLMKHMDQDIRELRGDVGGLSKDVAVLRSEVDSLKTKGGD